MTIAVLAGAIMAWAMVYPARNADRQQAQQTSQEDPK